MYDGSKQVTRLPLRDEIAFAARRIETRFGYSHGAIDRMLRAVFACHDLGKLDVNWQRLAHQWQKCVGKYHDGVDMSIPDDYMAAHTDFDGSKPQKEEQRKLGKRPRHAGESAIAAAGLLEQLCENQESLWRAALTAITRHHSARAEGFQPWRAHIAGKQSLEEALRIVGLPTELVEMIWWGPDTSESLGKHLVRLSPNHTQETLLYFMISRVIRLADQRSQAYSRI